MAAGEWFFSGLLIYFTLNIVSACRKTFSTIIGIGAIICTALSCWHPAVNAFALMLFLIPTISLMYCHMKV